MASRHWFYFCLCTGLDNSRDERISKIERCAQTNGLTYAKTEIADCVTIQVNIDSDDDAILFKLCAETALAEGHSSN